ncbi:MAG: hypothetical protein ACTSUO_07530 [Candidatus Thorarchaeota archaeon]
MDNISDMDIIVQTQDGSISQGTLILKNEDIWLELKDEELIPIDTNGISYKQTDSIVIDSTGQRSTHELKVPLQIRMKPIVYEYRPYSPNLPEQYEENIYPYSTSGWYGRMFLGGIRCLYIIQEVKDVDLYWLLIIDPKTGTVFHRHIIQPYELMPFKIKTGWELKEKRIRELGSSNPSEVRTKWLDLLDEPALTWSELNSIVEGIRISVLRRGETIRTTLERFVPLEYPSHVREEMMLFLAWITREKNLPKEDPVEFFDNLFPLPIARSLLMGYFQYLLDNEDPPNYLKLMKMATLGTLREPILRIDETSEKYNIFWALTMELLSDWRGEIIEHIKQLIQSESITICLPVTKLDAQKSVTAWRTRLGMLSLGVMLRTHIRPETLGLKYLLYLGNKHRWANPHLSFSVRLSTIEKLKPPYLQVMIMPKPALMKADRIYNTEAKLKLDGDFIKGRIGVVWSERRSNLNLFNSEENQWILPTKKIVTSMSKKQSVKTLRRKFGFRRNKSLYTISKKEAQILDITSAELWLTDLENPQTEKVLGITKEETQTTLTKLRDEGVISIAYEIRASRLLSIFTLLEGPPSQVCSIAGAFLDNTPTSLAMVSKNENLAIIISRIPSHSIDELKSKMHQKAEETDLIVQFRNPEAYRSYNWDLYQRLLRKDGTWDDDISIIESQSSWSSSK